MGGRVVREGRRARELRKRNVEPTRESEIMRCKVGKLVVEFTPIVGAAMRCIGISSALTDEAVRNGSIKKVEKRGNVREPNKDKNGRDDIKGLGLEMLLLLPDIRLTWKCNGRIPRGLKPKEETFQVVLDALALTPCYPAFLITVDVPEICPRVHGRDFDALPSKEDTISFLRDLAIWKNSGFDKLRLSRAQILWGMYHQKYVDYVELLWEDFTYQIDNKVYKKQEKMRGPPKGCYLFSRTCSLASPSKKESELVPGDEEAIKKGKRLKTPIKKSASKPATGIVIREPPVETKSKRKEKLKGGFSSWKRNRAAVKTLTSNNEQESSDESSKQENESEEQESNLKQDEESNDDDQEEEEFNQENESEDDKMKRNTTKTATETTQEQVVEDAHVTISTVTKKTEVPATSSSRSSDLASKFLNFSDIPHTDAEIVSPFDVPVQHEVPNTQTTTLLPIPVSVITTIPQSLQTFTPPPLVSTPTPPPTTEATNPPTTLPDFASVFRFNDRITALEKEVAEIKKDPLHTQVTSLVDEHLDTRLGETREEFMNFLSESLTARIKEQVKDQLPQILPKEVSNFAPPVIEKLIKESRDEVTLAKVSSQPQSTYEAASTLTEFELKKILLDKMEKNKDKDEDPSVGSDRGLKKRKLSKDAEPTTGPKKKDSTSGSSKGTKSQPKSSGKSVQSEEPVFEVADSDMPQDQEGNLGDNEDEPRNETASRRDWFKKPTPPQEPTDPD
ncbi:hypothetical protein Tco_0705674 [Tanacetum coccineum]|uniref:Uncharacterized protein n=1 Tax=Tanacetum coccineum TaxID=301880 RepID=A0ABQ4Y6S8_9ASTR